MNMSALLERARRKAETLMTDTCRIERAQSSTQIDLETFLPTIPATILYEGRCRVQTSGGIASATNLQGETSTLSLTPEWSVYLQLPITVTGLEAGDSAIITSSMDPDLTGRRYRLVNQQSEKSHATARRWNVKETPQKEKP